MSAYQPSIDSRGNLISQPCQAGSIIASFEARHIQPDCAHRVDDGDLQLWLVGNLYAARVVTLSGWRLTSPVLYINTTEPKDIAADVMARSNRIASPDERGLLDALGTEILRAELNRRLAKSSPKPKNLAPCVECRAPLSARERRIPCPHCGARNPR